MRVVHSRPTERRVEVLVAVGGPLHACPHGESAGQAQVLDHPDLLRQYGSGVPAGGGKWPGLWMWPLRALVTQLHAPFINDFTGFDQPWRHLARHIPDFHVRELAFGAGYLALGHAPVSYTHLTLPTTPYV